MAQVDTKPSSRPLSPHLSIWRWGPGMLLSILHRVSGDGLSIVGLPLLLWWLGALVSGPEAYATLVHWVWAGEPGNMVQSVTNVLGKIALVGLTWAFMQHMLSGLRHLVLDTGAGYELNINKTWSVVAMVAAPVLTAAFWAALLLR